MKTKNRKTEIMRFRCDEWLKNEVAKIALLQGLDESDIGRMAMKRFVLEFGQPPKTGMLIHG